MPFIKETTRNKISTNTDRIRLSYILPDGDTGFFYIVAGVL